jgi:hypothetical protein
MFWLLHQKNIGLRFKAMATKEEEDAEQAFFADKVKEQEKMDKHTKAEPKEADESDYRDSLGQPNPAHDFEKKNIADAGKRQEEKEAEAKKPKKRLNRGGFSTLLAAAVCA